MTRFLLAWIVIPLLGIALAPEAVRFVLAVHQDYLPQWAADTGWPARVAFGLMLAAVAGLVVLRRRARVLDAAAAVPFVRLWLRHEPGATFRDEVVHDGVKWQVRAEGGADPLAPPEIAVDLPPRCPACGAKLSESDAAGSLRWSCASCGFDRESDRDLRRSARRAGDLAWLGWKLARRERKRRSRTERDDNGPAGQA